MKKNRFTVLVLAITCFGFFSCSSNDDDATPVSNLTLEARTIVNSETSSPSVVAGANLLNASMRVRDVGVIRAGDAASSRTLLGDAAARQVTLLNSGLPAQSTNIGSAVLPHDNYDRITLRLDRGQELAESDAMRNRSLFISGTVNNMILNVYTDVEEIITRNFNGGALNHNGPQTIYLDVNMNTLFSGIDLTTAVDGDGNETIEIEPSNTDGNREIYNRMIDNLPNAITVSRE